MNGLLPIIRRQRRPLIVEEPKPIAVATPVAKEPDDKTAVPPVIAKEKADAPGSTQTVAAQ